MTTPTQGEHAQTEALRPKFGDLLRNTMASESNPRRDAYFIREVHRSGGGVNPGRWFEMTDGKGETWLSNPQNMVPAATAQPAAPQGVAYAALPAKIDPCEVRAKLDPTANPDEYALCVGADMWNACIDAAHALRVASNGQAPAGAAPEPIAYLHDDGYWTPAKTDEGRKLNDRLHFAGSPKIGVHLTPTAQAAPAAEPLCWLRAATATRPELSFMPCLPGDPNGYPVFRTAPTPAAQADSVPAQVLVAALIAAKQAINSMKVEAETAAQGDEQMMLEACETISNEGLQADIAIRTALESAQSPAPSVAAVDYPHARRFGGCPSCGRSDCVAMSCTRADQADLLQIADRKQGCA